MSRTGVVVGVAALAGLGIYAALPDAGPEYLGDMPSMMQQAEVAANPARPEQQDPPEPVAPPVDPPGAAAVEAPPRPGPPVATERVPAPVTDAPGGAVGGSATGGSPGGPSSGLLDFLDGLPLDGVLVCVGVDTVLRPDGSVVDCLTGVITPPPIDPPDLPVEVPIEVPVDVPVVE
jgi:hypothetical protein